MRAAAAAFDGAGQNPRRRARAPSPGGGGGELRSRASGGGGTLLERRVQHQRLTAALDGQRDALADLLALDQAAQRLSVVDGDVVDGDEDVAGLDRGLR